MMNFTEEDLARAKNALLKDIENSMSRTTDFAVELTEFIGAGDWRLWFLNRDRIEKLSVADLKAVAVKYYKTSNRTYGVFIPDAAPGQNSGE
jgi:zinc protease